MRVEVLNLSPCEKKLPEPLFGTILSLADATNEDYEVALEASHYTEGLCTTCQESYQRPRCCTLAELRPAADARTGWVPFRLYKEYLYDHTTPEMVDLKLADEGRHWVFNCWPKRRPPLFLYFLQMDKPYRQYNEFEIFAVRPSE